MITPTKAIERRVDRGVKKLDAAIDALEDINDALELPCENSARNDIVRLRRELISLSESLEKAQWFRVKQGGGNG